MSTVAFKEAGFASKTWALVRKDVKIELRSRDTLVPMLAFCLAVVLMLAFSLPGGTEIVAGVSTPAGTVSTPDVLAGFLWVTILFAGLIAFARTFQTEREEAAMDPLLLAPLDRSALFLGKATANLFYIAAVEIFLIPAFLLLFQIQLGDSWPTFVAIVLLTDIGFVAIGTLFSALAAQTSSKELMLPIIAVPVLVPVFIAAFELTSDLFLGAGSGAIVERGWFGILVGFDIIFAIVGALAADFVLDAG